MKGKSNYDVKLLENLAKAIEDLKSNNKIHERDNKIIKTNGDNPKMAYIIQFLANLDNPKIDQLPPEIIIL